MWQIVNSWNLFKTKTNQPKYPLLSFKASLAASLMTPTIQTKKRGRPSANEDEVRPPKKRTAPPKVQLEIRFDGSGHYPKKVFTSNF